MAGRFFAIFCCLLATLLSLNNGFDLDSDEIFKLQEVVEDLRIQFSQPNVTLSEEELLLKQVIDDIPSTTGREPGISDLPLVCAMCSGLSNLALYLRRVVRYDDRRAMDLAIGVCNLLRIQNDEVCRGVLAYNVPPILFIIDNHKELTGDTICKIILDQGRCSRPPIGTAAKNLDFTVNIDGRNSGRKKSLESAADVIIDESSRATQGESLTIVQITDIHYDPSYAEGSPVECGVYACCRNVNNAPSGSSKTAGRWGDYHKCDTPWRAIVNAFEKIKNTFNVGMTSV